MKIDEIYIKGLVKEALVATNGKNTVCVSMNLYSIMFSDKMYEKINKKLVTKVFTEALDEQYNEIENKLSEKIDTHLFPLLLKHAVEKLKYKTLVLCSVYRCLYQKKILHEYREELINKINFKMTARCGLNHHLYDSLFPCIEKYY
jgi:hypothetical protein